MLTKRILKLSINYGKLVFAPKTESFARFCKARTYTDHVATLAITDDKSQKIQYKLNDCSNSSVLLDLLEFNFKDQSLNSSDIIKVLTKLVKLYELETLAPQILHENFLKNVCVSINSRIDNLELSETIKILELLCDLKIPTTIRTISYLLKRINTLLSKASIEDYNKIMQLVSRMSPTPSTQAMKQSLKKKFILKLSAELDKKNFEFLVESFKFACLYTNDMKIIKIIIDALLTADFDTKSSQSIVSIIETLSSLNNYPIGWNKILSKAQNSLIKNIEKVSNEDIATILMKTSFKVYNKGFRQHELYNKTLFDEAIQKLISSDCNSKDGLKCLKAINNVRHTSKDLLNYLSADFYTQKEVEKTSVENEHSLIFRMLEGFAYLKYKPIFWDPFVNALKSKEILKYNLKTLMIAAHHLACLEHYEPEMLKRIFESDSNFDDNRFVHYTFLKLYQKLKTIPDYTGPLPSKAQLDSFEFLTHNNLDHSLYAGLKEFLGGPQYIKTNVLTKLYHQIDYLIAFQPEGIPLAINADEEDIDNPAIPMEYLENLDIPANCQIVAVLRVPSQWYARNTNQLLGTNAVYIETLESLSCHVAVIPNRVWQLLPEDSKISFLKDTIKSKLENHPQ